MPRSASFALVALLSLGAACGTAPPDTVAPDEATTAAVERVIDGDTLVVTIEGERRTVRLIGINAPEQDECYGAAARDALEKMTDGTVRLVPGAADDVDRFGRLLRYVEVSGTDVNAALLEGGHALALARPHNRLEDYSRLSASAGQAQVGLWRRDICGPPSSEGLIIAAVEPDPPGADDAQGGGEFVVIRHTGDEPQKLGGWLLRDESSVHRYTFPDTEILPGEEYTVFIGCGPDDGSTLFWCANGPVLSNGADTVLLLDPQGNVVDYVTYRR